MFKGQVPRIHDPWKLGKTFTKNNLLDLIEHPLARIEAGQCVKTGGLSATLIDAQDNDEAGRLFLVGMPMIHALLEYVESLPNDHDTPKISNELLVLEVSPMRASCVVLVEGTLRPKLGSILKNMRSNQHFMVLGVNNSNNQNHFLILLKENDTQINDKLVFRQAYDENI
jgi:hypothetical protein